MDIFENSETLILLQKFRTGSVLIQHKVMVKAVIPILSMINQAVV